MATWVERFPQAYQEWVQAGGVENNFRAHALAIGLALPESYDLTFMANQLHTVTIQNEQVNDRFSELGYIDPEFIPATGRAADISYLTGEIDQAFCNFLKCLGVDLVIVGLQNLALANSQLSVLLAAKMKCHCYIWPQNQDLTVYMPLVHGLMIRYAIPIIWVDVEDSEVNVKQAVQQLSEHPEFKTGIYTSLYMWQRWMNSTVTYSHLPLWYAQYDYWPDMSTFIPFAGWTVPTMKQYDARDNHYDLDVYNPALIA
jgi:hypothetical protein